MKIPRAAHHSAKYLRHIHLDRWKPASICADQGAIIKLEMATKDQGICRTHPPKCNSTATKSVTTGPTLQHCHLQGLVSDPGLLLMTTYNICWRAF